MGIDIDGPAAVQEEPTITGWYHTTVSSDWMIYSLYQGQWYAHVASGEVTPCVWGYIAQAGAVELVPGLQAGGPV